MNMYMAPKTGIITSVMTVEQAADYLGFGKR